MAKFILLLSLVSVSLAQDSLASSDYQEVEPGQYVHNPEWDLTPYQLWKRKQAAKSKGAQVPENTIAAPVQRKVVTVRKHKPVQKVQQQQQRPVQQQQQPRFENFQAVQQPSLPSRPRQQAQPAFQPRREQQPQQKYYQPAPKQQNYYQPAAQQQQYYKPAVQQQIKPAVQQQIQPAYNQQQTSAYAYPRAQHQTYTPEYISEANNNAQRFYHYTAPKYEAQAKGESYSYKATY